MMNWSFSAAARAAASAAFAAFDLLEDLRAGLEELVMADAGEEERLKTVGLRNS
jgi:hypothetical protein